MSLHTVRDLPSAILNQRSGLVFDILHSLAHLRSPMPKGHSMSKGARSREEAFKAARRQSLERCRAQVIRDLDALSGIHSELDPKGKRRESITVAEDVARLESAWVDMRLAARKLALRASTQHS